MQLTYDDEMTPPYPEMTRNQLAFLRLAALAGSLWEHLPDDPFDISEWMDVVDAGTWAGAIAHDQDRDIFYYAIAKKPT